MNKLPFNPASSEDIPPARRQPTEVPLYEIENASKKTQPKKKRRKLPVTLLFLTTAVASSIYYFHTMNSIRDSAKEELLGAGSLNRQAEPQAGERAIARGVVSDRPPTPKSTPKSHPDTLLNHHHYDEAPPDTLAKLNPNSEIKLRPAAQISLNAMIAKAKADGVQLGVVSGFRSIEDQDYLYFKVKAERGESAKARAEVSAPPGYSEHHTGYAVDLIDESQPATYVEESFVTTPAYRWLMKNAAFFNFEMSFPQNNKDLVAYEPWHWRYVGDQKSLELFYGDQQ